MDYKAIFRQAYELMNEPIIDGNCGELCDYHCCRSNQIDKDRLGIYLLPFEFEAMQDSMDADYEVHSSKKYVMPIQIKKLYYIFCDGPQGCMRGLRPIQCRTYPFEPHIDNDVLYLVIEKDQIHNCPLLSRQELWRWEFVKGIYDGWELLLKIPKINHYITELSKARNEKFNYVRKYDIYDLENTFKKV